MDSFNPSENERMEAWLDDHLNFAHSYFVRKATRDMVNAWFAERVHSIPAHKEGTKLPAEPSPIHQTAQPENTTPGTPIRKISASEFDRPLRPIVVKDSEGAFTFVCDSEKVQMPLKPQILGAGEGQVSNQCTRLLELVKDISTHLDVTALCHKIFLHINELIDADRYSLFLVCEDSSNEKFLISRLFDVAEDSTLEEASNNCIRLEWNKGIVGHVAATGQPLNIRNAYEDPRFNAGVDQITGYKTQSILCMPIKNHREEVVGVAQAINKKCGKNGAFTEQDEKDFSAYLAFCGIVLHNAQLYETSRLENRRNQVLLDLASLIFEEQQSLEVILKKIAATILSFMQAQRCTIFIADGDISNENAENSNKQIKSLLCTPIKNGKKDKVIDLQMLRLVFQAIGKHLQTLENGRRSFLQNSRKPMQYKLLRKPLIAKLAATVKKLILSAGVCQLVNKMDDVTGKIKAFNRNDEQFLEAFAIFCGLGIQNTQMYETVDRAMAKQVVTLEVLSYHASASEEETRELQAAKVPSAQSLKLLDFSFSDFELSDMETTLATIRMFMDLNLVQNFQMKYEVRATKEHINPAKGLCQWVLSVKKNYRKNIAYHNWRHAFNTSQCMFAVLKSGRIQNKLNDLEMLALMIATLCHDLDHRGVNNSYIQRSEHPLAQLYCHSTMEHHHFDQCLMILNSPGNQILSGLSLEEYRTTLKMIERAILATDLALYMKSEHPLAQLYCHSTMEHHHFDQCLMILNSPGNQILSGLSLEEYRTTLKMIERAILATDLALYMKKRGEFFELTKNRQFMWEDENHRDLLR
ncbi:UNVERIFIED_CONTAM: hypothetical protein FKN15_031653 [Acipenser sinensis]